MILKEKLPNTDDNYFLEKTGDEVICSPRLGRVRWRRWMIRRVQGRRWTRERWGAEGVFPSDKEFSTRNLIKHSQRYISIRGSFNDKKWQPFSFVDPEAEFKEFEQRFKFKPRLKFWWLHLNLNWIFPDLSRRSI